MSPRSRARSTPCRRAAPSRISSATSAAAARSPRWWPTPPSSAPTAGRPGSPHGRACAPPARPVADTGTMEQPLPDRLARRLAAFDQHLAAERGLSAHTVRAYLGDIRSLLRHAGQAGMTDLAGLDVGMIRGWLAAQHAAGQARSTLARRAAAARTFTAFAGSRGWLATDPGPLLGTPKAQRHLPQVLAAELDAAGGRHSGGEAPAAGRGAAAGRRPAPGERDHADDGAASGQDPVAGQDPPAGQDPVASRDPVGGQDPSAGQDPAASQDPVAAVLDWRDAAIME